MLKLHIGCGEKYLPGYVHVDARQYPHVDYVAAAEDLHMFADGAADEVYACHILEHIGRHGVDAVLREWSRVLRPGGIARIAVPDFEAVAEHYMENRDLSLLIGLLYGGQNHALNYHRFAFDFKTLQNKLEQAGFENVRRYDWRMFLPAGEAGKPYDDFSRCYLPHMDFEHGRLMSLNVLAEKRQGAERR